MNVTETVFGIAGEFLLLITSTLMVLAVLTIILALDEDPKEHVATGTPFVVAMGAIYIARGHLEKRQLKKLSITTLMSATALAMAVIGLADGNGARIWQTLLAYISVTTAATIVTLFIYAFRITYLAKMFRRKRNIVAYVLSGNYATAVAIAEATQGTNYVKNPRLLSETAKTALADALDNIGRSTDAEYVRSAQRRFP